jgi:hypothetical protein
MTCVTVRNEGESYLYSYLRSGTGTTGEPTGTTDPKGFDRYNQPTGDYYEKIAYRYYRSFTGTTGQRPVPPVVQILAKTSFAGKRLTGTTGLSPVPPVKGRYYRSTTDTTARTKTRRTKALTPAGFMPTGTTGGSPVLPVLPGIKHFSKCP